MYKISVNNRAFSLTLSKNRFLSGTINGKDFSWDITEYSPGCFHILDGTMAYRAEVIKADYTQKSFVLRVNGKKYSVAVHDQLDELLQQLGIAGGSRSSAKELKAPMPGLVVNVSAKEGQVIKKDDALLVLEAMKMENVLKAASDGTVKKILVAKGAKVEKNETLVVFE